MPSKCRMRSRPPISTSLRKCAFSCVLGFNDSVRDEMSIAARIQNLTGPGGMCISGTAHTFVRDAAERRRDLSSAGAFVERDRERAAARADACREEPHSGTARGAHPLNRFDNPVPFEPSGQIGGGNRAERLKASRSIAASLSVSDARRSTSSQRLQSGKMLQAGSPG